MDAAKPPHDHTHNTDLELAARYAPIIQFDAAEPFLPLAVGVTIFADEANSPSFPRRILREYVPPWRKVVEYAIWWDWDIGHLYELEHAWSYIDAEDRLVWAEASGHGDYSAMSLAGARVSCEGTHPVLYSQPGKHAFAPEPICLERLLHFVVKDAAYDAGERGVLVMDRYAHAIRLQDGDHARATAWLHARAFMPTMQFTQRFAITRELLVPWPVLNDWIPARVKWWLEQLRFNEATIPQKGLQ